MKMKLTMSVAELKELALKSFQKVNPSIELADIQEDVEGQYEDRTFGGFKVESERGN
jgi:hypothetical protein